MHDIEYHFTGTTLADYIDKVRVAWEAQHAAKIERLRAALKPFSDMAGELFSRNWNASQIVTFLDNPNDPHRVTAGDYFAARAAIANEGDYALLDRGRISFYFNELVILLAVFLTFAVLVVSASSAKAGKPLVSSVLVILDEGRTTTIPSNFVFIRDIKIAKEGSVGLIKNIYISNPAVVIGSSGFRSYLSQYSNASFKKFSLRWSNFCWPYRENPRWIGRIITSSKEFFRDLHREVRTNRLFIYVSTHKGMIGWGLPVIFEKNAHIIVAKRFRMNSGLRQIAIRARQMNRGVIAFKTNISPQLPLIRLFLVVQSGSKSRIAAIQNKVLDTDASGRQDKQNQSGYFNQRWFSFGLSGLLITICVVFVYQTIAKFDDCFACGIAFLLSGWACGFLSVWIFLVGVMGWHLWPLTSLNGCSKNVIVEPIIVPELKFRNVQRQVFAADFVVTAHKPAFENAPEAFDGLGVNRADNILAFPVIDAFVRVVSQPVVAGVGIGAEQANLGRDSLANEILQTDRAHATDTAGDYVALALDGTYDREFAGSNPAGMAFAAVNVALFLVPVLELSADESFINLDNATELGFRLDQGGADFVAHAPSRPVAAKAHKPHDLKGAHALFAGEHHVDHAEPVPQVNFRVLEDGPCDAGKPIAIGCTGFALPMEAGSQLIDLHIAAAGAVDALGPPTGHQIGLAGVFVPGREQGLKLCASELVDRGRFGHGKSSFVEGYNHV